MATHSAARWVSATTGFRSVSETWLWASPALQDLARNEAKPSSKSNQASAKGRTRNGKPFNQAARLLRLIVEHVQTLDLADLRQSDLASRPPGNCRSRKRAGAPPKNAFAARTHPTTCLFPGSRVMQARWWANCSTLWPWHYSDPLTLRRYAEQAGMNAAYLSDLFSRTTGVPFKEYLTNLRLDKARELLMNPSQRVSTVAKSVGYSSENRFRIAFKKAAGLSPRLWRETLRREPDSSS